MNFVIKNRDDGPRFPKREGAKWYHWIPFFGYFLPSYPCFQIGLDIWHSLWIFTAMLLIASNL